MLNDVEDKHITKPSARDWLAGLRNLAYDVEDVLDEFNNEVMRRKLAADIDVANTNKVSQFIPTFFSNFSPIEAKHNVKIAQKIKEITGR